MARTCVLVVASLFILVILFAPVGWLHAKGFNPALQLRGLASVNTTACSDDGAHRLAQVEQLYGMRGDRIDWLSYVKTLGSEVPPPPQKNN